MRAYEQVLAGGQGLFAASMSVDRGEWKAFIDAQDVQERFPGIQGLGYVVHVVGEAELQALVSQAHQEGYRDFTVSPEGSRSEYYVIAYLEPLDSRNQRAFGYDIFSEPARRAAVEQARDTGTAAITSKIILVQETDQDVQAGFLMMLPVYNNGMPHETVQERRAAIEGLVYAPFRMNDLMEGVIGSTESDVSFRIFDASQEPDNLMYDHGAVAGYAEVDYEPAFTKSVTFDIGGRQWIIAFTALDSIRDNDYYGQFVILAVGIVISVLIFYIMRSSSKLRREVTELSRVTEQIIKGELEAEVHPQLLQSEDQIGNLARAFDEMRLAVRKYTADLENANKDLQKSEQRTFNFLETLPLGFFALSSDGKPYYANQRSQEILGKGIVPNAGKNELSEVYHVYKAGTNTPYPPERLPVVRALAGETCLVDDLEIRQKDKTVPLEVWATPVRDSDGKIEYGVAVFTDISERKKLEKSKDEFISMMSHELKTPLVPIKGYAEMMLKPGLLGELNEKQKKAVQAIIRNCNALDVLVQDVLSVYKLDMGRMIFSKVDTDVAELVNRNIYDLQSLTTDKQIQIKSDIQTSGNVFCDPARIDQVLGNLIKNSVDFVPPKDGRITIRAEQDQDSHVVFTVEDNGPGIPADKADKLFQKFYQIDTSATRKHGGTGLGLSICKGIIEAHGGRIWIDKTYTKGASVKFTLPRSNGDAIR